MAKSNIFTSVEVNDVPQSRFDLSHDVKLSYSMGELIPVLCMETIPGDSFRIGTQNLIRFAPMLSPVMHKIYCNTHYFFVPNRILWPGWEKWITGDEETEAPYVRLSTVPGDVQVPLGSVADYLGLPTEAPAANEVYRVSPFPVAAYFKIFDDWYRDQNLQPELFLELIPGDNTALQQQRFEYQPLKRAWMHDYFTSCLPFAQKGDPVQIPLVTQNDIPVDFNNNTGTRPVFRRTDTSAYAAGALSAFQTSGTERISDSTQTSIPLAYDPAGTLSVDVQAGATDINSLRRAFRLQEWLEKNARGGTRYIEHIRAHFNVKSSDARFQRAEYIGGISQNVVISEVLNTAGAESGGPTLQPVGAMAGHGISVGGGGVTFFAEEHGYIIGIMSVLPVTAYQQGIHRNWTRFDRLDYAWPTFANIGEQEVRVKELYINGLTAAAGEETFGYIPRYAEYKYMNSRVAGDFRENLSFWHMGRIFAAKPVLNESFISASPTTRIFAVEDPAEDHLWGHVFHRITAVRRLPKYGIPTI